MSRHQEIALTFARQFILSRSSRFWATCSFESIIASSDSYSSIASPSIDDCCAASRFVGAVFRGNSARAMLGVRHEYSQAMCKRANYFWATLQRAVPDLGGRPMVLGRLEQHMHQSRDVQSDRDGNPVHLAHNVQLRCTPRPTCCENAQSLCLK